MEGSWTSAGGLSRAGLLVPDGEQGTWSPVGREEGQTRTLESSRQDAAGSSVGESGQALERATSPRSKSNLNWSRQKKPRYPGWVQKLHLGETQGITESFSQRSPPDALCCCSRWSSIRQSPSPKCWRILASLPLRRGSGYRRRERSAWRGLWVQDWVKVGLAVRPGLHLFPIRPGQNPPSETQIACGALCWLPRPATRSASVRREGWGKQAAGVSGPAGRALP